MFGLTMAGIEGGGKGTSTRSQLVAIGKTEFMDMGVIANAVRNECF